MIEEIKAWVELDLIKLKNMNKKGYLKDAILEEAEELRAKGVEKYGNDYNIEFTNQISSFIHDLGESTEIEKEVYNQVKEMEEMTGGKILEPGSEEYEKEVEIFKNIIPLVNEDFKKYKDFFMNRSNSIFELPPEDLTEEDKEETVTEFLDSEVGKIYRKRFVEDFNLDTRKLDTYMELVRFCIATGEEINIEDVRNIQILQVED